MGHVFISYARQDRAFVGRLAQEIRSRGIPVWEDSHIEHGQAWYRTIEQQLDQSSVLVLVMTEASRESTWVNNELLRAQRKGIPVRPLLVDGDPWLAIESVNFVDLRDGAAPDEAFFEDLARVTSATSDEDGPPAAADTPPDGAAPSRDRTERHATDASRSWSPRRGAGGVPSTRRLVTVGAVVLAVGVALLAGSAVIGRDRADDPRAATAGRSSPSPSPAAPATTPPASPVASPASPASPSPTVDARNVVGADDFRVNFQRRGAEQPEGYLVDYGQPFGEQASGLAYGWVEPGTSTPMDMTAHARDRDVVEDQLRDTLMHFRNFNPATQEIDVASWEFAVEPGTYLVRVVVGEPQPNDNVHNLTVEGVPAITDFVSVETGQAQEDNTVVVEVDDGRLTLATVPRGATKIAFAEIERLP